MDNQPMLIQAFHLSKVHPSGVKVLDDAFFSAPEGSMTAVIGESRTGKSTFLKMLAGEDEPTSGVLRINHMDIYGISRVEKQHWLSEVGMIFPDLKLFPNKTVEENILFILQVKGAASEGQKEAVAKLLSKAGLSSKASARPGDLSSGEQRMVLALRAMIFWPKLLLADEPFQGLDEKSASTLFRFFQELHKSGSTIVFTLSPDLLPEETRKAAFAAGVQWVQLERGKFQSLEREGA
jgi:cell division transport system ATP-binding protein